MNNTFGEWHSYLITVDASTGKTIPRGRVLTASFVGRRRTLSDAAVFGVVARNGLLSVKVIGAIHWQALKLWLKGLRLQPQPSDHPVTIIAKKQVSP